MAMTRKNFEAVARVISDERVDWQDNPQVQNALSYVVSGLASHFSTENDNFDRARFVEACSMGAAMARIEKQRKAANK